jgi:CubicO group peptidase (beta-lactamase class C family)
VDALLQIDGWPVGATTAGVVTDAGPLAVRGPADREFRWASITKLATALAVMIAVEEGTLTLDQPAGPPGATIRHLLAHASGLPFLGSEPVARPGTRRVYSNTGYEILASVLSAAAGMPFDQYLGAAVLQPLRLASTWLEGTAAAGLNGPLSDLLRFAIELLQPSLVAASTFAEMTSVAYPGLDGMLPGIGRMRPMDWGLGFELRDAKYPHWTGRTNSPETFGHFGGSGSFLWVDPRARVACASLSDREFGPWALEVWPRLADSVLAEVPGRV